MTHISSQFHGHTLLAAVVSAHRETWCFLALTLAYVIVRFDLPCIPEYRIVLFVDLLVSLSAEVNSRFDHADLLLPIVFALRLLHWTHHLPPCRNQFIERTSRLSVLIAIHTTFVLLGK